VDEFVKYCYRIHEDDINLKFVVLTDIVKTLNDIIRKIRSISLLILLKRLMFKNVMIPSVMAFNHHYNILITILIHKKIILSVNVQNAEKRLSIKFKMNVNVVGNCSVKTVSAFVIIVMMQFIVNDVLIHVLTVTTHNLPVSFSFY